MAAGSRSRCWPFCCSQAPSSSRCCWPFCGSKDTAGESKQDFEDEHAVAQAQKTGEKPRTTDVCTEGESVKKFEAEGAGVRAEEKAEDERIAGLVAEALRQMEGKLSEDSDGLSRSDKGATVADVLFSIIDAVCGSLENVPWVGFAFKLYTSGKTLLDTAGGNDQLAQEMVKHMEWLYAGLRRLKDDTFKDEKEELAKCIAKALLAVISYGKEWKVVRVVAAASFQELLQSRLQAVRGMKEVLDFAMLADIHSKITELSKNQSFNQRLEHAEGAKRLIGGIQSYEGLKEKVEEIVGRMKAAGGNTIGVFALNAMGGIGKTTLAAAVFDDDWVRRNYDRVCWVEVKKDPTEKEIVDQQAFIYMQLTGLSSMDRESGKSLLTKQMSDHKVFLVLDNVWDPDNLPVECPPPSKSCVLLTTRNKTVATSLAGEENVYPLQTLSQTDSLQLLCKSAKLTLSEVDEKLREVLEKVVRRCGQLPLALSVLGSSAAAEGELRKNCKWWERRMESWNKQSKIDRVYSVLQQSYSAAPSQSRLTFLLVVAFLPNWGASLLSYLAVLLGDDEYGAYESMKDINDRSLVSVSGTSSPDELGSLLLPNASENDAVTGIFVHDLLRDVATKRLSRGSLGERSFKLARDMWGDPGEPNTVEHLVIKERVAITDWAIMSKLRSAYIEDTDPSLLSHILKLDSLASLVFFNNKICGSIPPEISNLTNLTYLDLSQNQLQGSIPSELSNLTNLRYLNLFFNQLSGSIPQDLSSLTNLTYLNLCFNSLEGSIPPQLSKLTNLESLDLSHNFQLSGSIPSELSALRSLRQLSLSSTWITGTIPEELFNLTNLTQLSLSSNQLTGSIPPNLSALTNLRQLNLSDNKLSGSIPPGLSALTNLMELRLYGNQLSGSIPQELSALTNLVRIDLYMNGLSGSIPKELSALTKLETLNLFINLLSGIPPELSALTNLPHLNLSHNQLSGSIPPELSALTNLENIDLSHNQLSGSIPPSLSTLKNLKNLDLSHNQLSESIPPRLSTLKNLENLDLSHNQLSGSIPQELSALTKLRHLSLSANDLSGSIPPELSTITDLT